MHKLIFGGSMLFIGFSGLNIISSVAMVVFDRITLRAIIPARKRLSRSNNKGIQNENYCCR